MRILVKNFHQFWVFKSLKTFQNTVSKSFQLGTISLMAVTVILLVCYAKMDPKLENFLYGILECFKGFEPQELGKIS